VFEQAGRRTQVMGILNVTEDSFSDGGRYIDFDKAIEHAFALRDAGADLIDVGGESTRPGAVRVPEAVEHARVIPVITELSRAGIVTSVDTMRASVASAAVAAGVSLINDVSGGQADPNMLRVMADAQVSVCLMHWQTDRFGAASVGGCASPRHAARRTARRCVCDPRPRRGGNGALRIGALHR